MDKPESEQIKHKTYVLELPAPDNYMQGGRNSPVKVIIRFHLFRDFQKSKTRTKIMILNLKMII